MHKTMSLTSITKEIASVESTYSPEIHGIADKCNALHSQIINRPRPERRELYVDKEYVLLERVLDWKKTCPQDKQITVVRTKSDEDIKLASEINTKVAISKEKWYHIECDAVLVGPNCGGPKMPDSTDVFTFSVDTDLTMVGNIEVIGGFRLPANYEFLCADGVVDVDTITEFLDQSVKLKCRSLTVEWPYSKSAGQDQQIWYVTAFMAAVKTWLEDNYKKVDKIIFCAREDANYDNLMELMPTHFPVYRLEPDPPLEVAEVVEAGFNRVVEAIGDLTNKICDAIAGRNAEQTEQLDSNRKTKRRDEPDETSPIKKIKGEK